jgi:putative phosphoribosyl transferase
VTEEVAIGSGHVTLPGSYTPPTGGRAVVVFAHGSGSSRVSPRNAAVAGPLHARGFGTLLFDLLAEDESLDRRNVFDIDLLADRLVAAVGWTRGRTDPTAIGLFGASTGAAAALVAASRLPGIVRAVVSRGGRPDLAAGVLAEVTAPTLLIVGERDADVLALNRDAQGRMTSAETRLDVVPGATHLFEEPGALERVADLAAGWFQRHVADQGA